MIQGMVPGASLRAHVAQTQSLIGDLLGRPPKTPLQLQDSFAEEQEEFEQNWTAFSAHLQMITEEGLNKETLSKAVHLYLEMVQESGDVLYNGVGCLNAGISHAWEEILERLDQRIDIRVAIRAYGSKYGRRSVGLGKGEQERLLLASPTLPTDLALPYKQNDGLWIPTNWQPYSPVRSAEDLRLTLSGVRESLAFINLGGFIFDTDLRFKMAASQGISPWSPQLFALDRKYPRVTRRVEMIEQYCNVFFISTSWAEKSGLDQAVYQANIDLLNQHGLWSTSRQLILRPHYAKMSGMSGAEWTSEIIWQEIRRKTPQVVLIGNDRQDIQDYQMQRSEFEMMGAMPLIRTSNTLSQMVKYSKRFR